MSTQVLTELETRVSSHPPEKSQDSQDLASLVALIPHALTRQQ
jgi:hypothetical protein